jgi:capsid assembly protease
MADLPILADMLYNRPHLVLPSYAETVASVLAHRMNVAPLVATTDVSQRPARNNMLTKDGILVLPVVGGLYHRGDSLDAMSGAQSFTHLQNVMIAAIKNPDVKGILLDIDSPGGQAIGCFEFCDALVSLGTQKPIRSIINGIGASGGYAIAAATEKVYAIPSAQVGSIGVVMMHIDRSKMAQAMGIAVTYIYAGDHKVDGNPFEPLPKSVAADMQAGVDALYTKFVTYVASRRPMTDKQVRATEAAVVSASRAVAIGLADKEATFDAALAEFAADIKSPQKLSGARQQMTTQTQAPADGGANLSEAISRAYSDGQANARAGMQGELAASYSRGRADACAIMGHAEAKGRRDIALNLAGDAAFTADKATEMLTLMPKKSKDDAGAAFVAKLDANNPQVKSGADVGSNTPATGASNFQQMVDANVRHMLGKK